jgi:PAS domain S-box-containing protein
MMDFVDGQEQILRKTRDPLLLMDESGDILDASDGACSLLGYDREELVNMSLFDLYQRPTIRKERQETFRPILKEGTGDFEAWIRNNDGQDFPARIAAQSLEVEGGTLILALMQDISGEVEEENVLRREAEWLRGALADIEEAMLILDLDGTVRMVNRDAADLAGRTREELEGQLGWTVFENHELEQAIHEIFQSCMKGEEAEGREVVLEMAEEPLRIALSARSLLREEKLDGCMIRLRNITRETAVLKDLEESCELYRNLVEGAPEGIYLVDREGAFIYANDHLREMLGKNREDLVLGSILDFIEPEQMDILKGYFRSRVAGLYAPPLRIDLRLEEKLVPVEMDCSLLEAEGEITGILGVVRDLTWRADLDMESRDCQVARDLIYSVAGVFVAVEGFEPCMEESLRVMVEHLGGDAGVLYGYDVDRDHLDILADTGLDESAIGYLQEKSLILREGCVGQILKRGESLQLAGEEMEGELLEELLAVRRQHVAAFPFGSGERLNGLAVVYSSEDGGLPDNRELYTALGDIFHISLNRAHLLDNLAEVCEKEALVDMELREAERIKNEFVSLVDEKLRAPVQRLRSFIENLERGWSHFSPAAIDDYFLQLRWEMTDLERIIDRLLLLSAQESGHLKLEVSPFEVTNLLEKVAQIFVSRSVEHEIELELPPYMLIIEADQALMESVFMSLMDNAIRFSPQGGTVRLSLNEKDRDVVILVKDEGLGFTDDEKDHIFEKFQKPLRREKEELTGLGLGLYLSRTVVELHGGRIDLISRPDEGSTFFVVLPKRRR